MYRFALRPKWIAAHIAIAAIGVGCVLAGLWQLSRHDERQGFIRLVTERRAQPVIGLRATGVRPDLVPADHVHARVRATGTYDTAQEVIVRSRSIASGPGHHVLTPLVTDDGVALIVDRGWVPLDLSEPPIARAAPPRGEVTVEGWLMPSEKRLPLAPSDPSEGRLESLARIDIGRFARQLPYDVYPVYLHLVTRSPEPAADLPLVEELPVPDSGRHLGYAIQWFLFVPVGVVGWGAILRREARKRTRAEAYS